MPAPARVVLPSALVLRRFDWRRAAAIVAAIGFAFYLLVLAHAPFSSHGR